ncbi:hypothetical protein TIFTF001_032217 [Ficus carica]|uniref:Uncharacterized protein n=1 Tax=Ficus carica TaxID=3494 RepID=A0AA88DWA2_FICCA|nr:hypothetical protein TIFTF001_032217 [Ficus carica]
MTPAATPSVIGLSSGDKPVALPSITCKREAPKNDGVTGVVSAAGTPILKSVGELAPLAGLGARDDPAGSAT